MQLKSGVGTLALALALVTEVAFALPASSRNVLSASLNRRGAPSNTPGPSANPPKVNNKSFCPANKDDKDNKNAGVTDAEKAWWKALEGASFSRKKHRNHKFKIGKAFENSDHKEAIVYLTSDHIGKCQDNQDKFVRFTYNRTHDHNFERYSESLQRAGLLCTNGAAAVVKDNCTVETGFVSWKAAEGKVLRETAFFKALIGKPECGPTLWDVLRPALQKYLLSRVVDKQMLIDKPTQFNIAWTEEKKPAWRGFGHVTFLKKGSLGNETTTETTTTRLAREALSDNLCK